jgi:uncharacterized MAPEG superfamily protein
VRRKRRGGVQIGLCERGRGMTTDLFILVLAALLAVVQLSLYAIKANLDVGTGYALGPRDVPVAMSTITGRLKRAYENHLETLPLFAIAVLVAHVTGTANPATALACQVYLGARVLYVPAYVVALPWLRSIIWIVAFAAIVTIYVQILAG